MTLTPDQARSLLSTFLADGEDDVKPTTDDVTVPDRIAGYNIIQLLGTGGMGLVFQARQISTGREVALKLIKSSIVSSNALRRFKHEVRMLARLKHPGIAQIYEAGAEETRLGPQPFFAMELVDGQPITTYCAESGSSIRRRLELFLAVCEAVEYAHQRGVIHRDLKPTNIFVDTHGHIRILDFGIARTTDDDQPATTILNTRTGQLMGTLPYMSPEQTAGGMHDLDTRSDVYSLGVVLYEILTGRLPYELNNLALPEAARVIQERSPIPPGTLDRALRGDRETILRTALQKEPERRYQSASLLAADIRRHLNDQPIIARPASAIYTLRKFVKRNKALAAGLAIAFLGLSAGLVGGTWQFARALDARRDAASQTALAQTQTDAMNAISQVLTDLIAAADPSNAGREARVIDVLRGSDAILASPLVKHPRIELNVRTTLGRVYLALGDLDNAEVHLIAAQQAGAEHFGSDDPALLQARSAFADLLLSRARINEAEVLAAEVFERQNDTLGHTHSDTINSAILLARIRMEAGSPARAYHALDAILPASIQRSGSDSRESNRIRLVMTRALILQARHAAAAALARDILDRQRRQYGENDPLTVETLIELGRAQLFGEDERDAATDTLRPAHARATRVFGREHPITLNALYLLAVASLENSELEASETFLRDVFMRRSGTFGEDHPETIQALQLLANVLVAQGLAEEAEPFLEALLASAEAGAEMVRERNELALIRFQAEDFTSAEALFNETLEARREQLGPEHPDTLVTMRNLAATLEKLGDFDEAEDLYLAAIAAWENRGGIENPRAVNVMAEYARFLAERNRLDEADRMYQRVINNADAAFPAGFSRIAILQSEYGRFLLRLQRYNEAEQLLLDAFAIFEATIDLDQPAAASTAEAIIDLYTTTGQAERRRAFQRRFNPASPDRQ